MNAQQKKETKSIIMLNFSLDLLNEVDKQKDFEHEINLRNSFKTKTIFKKIKKKK